LETERNITTYRKYLGLEYDKKVINRVVSNKDFSTFKVKGKKISMFYSATALVLKKDANKKNKIQIRIFRGDGWQ